MSQDVAKLRTLKLLYLLFYSSAEQTQIEIKSVASDNQRRITTSVVQPTTPIAPVAEIRSIQNNTGR